MDEVRKPMLVPLPVKGGRFVYANPEYIEYLYPAGVGFTDVYMATGVAVSVEGDEHAIYAMIRYCIEMEGEEEDEEEECQEE